MQAITRKATYPVAAVAAPAAPEAWHWIAVLAYLASVFARLAATGRVEATLAEHQTIVDAIAAGDVRGAREATRLAASAAPLPRGATVLP